MARVHHYGLRDRIRDIGKNIKYETRPLLGINDYDLKSIEKINSESIN